MAGVVYSLCALTACACAVLLLLSYQRTGNRMLLWSGLCFAGLTLNNVLVMADLIWFQGINLYTWRNLTGFVAMLLLVYGLIWEAK